MLNKLVGFTEEFQYIFFWRSRDTLTFCKHVVSEVQILINGFIFLPSMKCFMTVEGQLQKVTDKLNRNLPIMVVLWPHLLVIDRTQEYETSDRNLNFRVHMLMKGALKTQ